MTKLSEIKFDAKDLIQIFGFILFLGTMWLDLKTDQVKIKEQNSFLQYQINELKTQYAALKPEQVEIKTKR